MNKPPISVVMATRNVDRFLPEAIESILGQTFRDFEFVIVDFGSTDNSTSIISSYAARDSRIRLHCIPSCGLVEARNAGCFLARGRYIAIMDADDVSLPNRLLWEFEFMEKHPEVGVLGGAVEWINATGKSLLIARHPLGDRELQAELLTHSVVWQPTAFIRSDAFGLVGGYRGVFAAAEDYDLWLRIAERFQLANLEQVVLKYRIHPQQVSLRKRQQEILALLAAQVSASTRRRGESDPLDSVEEVTPTLLVRLGVSEARQQREHAWRYGEWVRHMYKAGEYAAALEAGLDLQHSALQYAEPCEAADLYLILARVWLKQKQFAKGLLAMGHAVITSPAAALTILASVFRWLGRVVRLTTAR